MSKAVIRNKKYAKAIRLGVTLGKKQAAEFGSHPTEYAFMADISQHYSLFNEPRLFDIARTTARTVWEKQMKKLRENVWTVEEFQARYEEAEFLNMDREEQQDYLLRKEVESLRAEVKAWNNLVGATQ